MKLYEIGALVLFLFMAFVAVDREHKHQDEMAQVQAAHQIEADKLRANQVKPWGWGK